MHSQPLYAKGLYVVVAVDRDGLLGDDARIDGYAVITTAGDPLRYETTFEAARDWVDRRLLDEPLTPAVRGSRGNALRRSQ